MNAKSVERLKKSLRYKGIELDKDKKKQFEEYNYFQVINAYKNIFYDDIERIDDIIKNINENKKIKEYSKYYSVVFNDEESFIRKIQQNICNKYEIVYDTDSTIEEVSDKIRKIDYYNHIYSPKVRYSDFIRIYKFEHELRIFLLKYTLKIEETIKNIFTSYLNNIGASGNFLTDINNYNKDSSNITDTVNSIKKVFDKQANKKSRPIHRKLKQKVTIPYWIVINDLTLGETRAIINNLSHEHRNEIYKMCIKSFTILNDDNLLKNHITTMNQCVKFVGNLRNVLAHNSPIYNYNVSNYSSQKKGNFKYTYPNNGSEAERSKIVMSIKKDYADFWGSDKINSNTQRATYDLSMLIYVIYKMIKTLDKNTTFYPEFKYVYQKYNIVLRPGEVSVNNLPIYESMLNEREYINSLKEVSDNIIAKYDDKKLLKKDLKELNVMVGNLSKKFNHYAASNTKSNECLKYNNFLFENRYTKYTGINHNYFMNLE